MIPSNQAWFALSKQSGLGSAVSAPTYKALYSGGSRVKGAKEHAQYEETDANRDGGDDYVQRLGAAGAPEAYFRASYGHLLLEALLGTRSTSGTTDKTHTITPANQLSYYTVHQMLGGVLFEQAEDVFVNSGTIKADTGGGVTVALDLVGRKNRPLAADPAGAVNPASDVVFNFNDVAVTYGGAATSWVRNFELTYDNGVQAIQTDDAVPTDLYAGKRSVTVGFDLYFNDLAEYNQFYYGSASPAPLAAQATSVRVVDVKFDFAYGANNGLTLDLPRVQIQEFPTEPATSGDPIVVAVRARAKRGGTPVLTATVKNQTP